MIGREQVVDNQAHVRLEALGGPDLAPEDAGVHVQLPVLIWRD